MRVDALDHGRHEEMWELIPWLVNGRLKSEVAATIHAHLEQCAECQREYADQLRIFGGMQPDNTIAFASEASFQKLAARLDANEHVRRARANVRWVAAASFVAALGLAAWGAWALQSLPTRALAAPYRTLTSPAPVAAAGAQLRVVFAPDLSLNELARLLHSVHAHISDGPTAAGVFTLSLTPSDSAAPEVAARLAALRADANVRFAEPVVATP
jgi:hypothetical protein